MIGRECFLPVAVSYESQQGNDMTYLQNQLLRNSGQVYSSGRAVTEIKPAFDFPHIILKRQTRMKRSADFFLIMLDV